MSTPKPKMADALVAQVSQLDGQISERKATVASLLSELGESAMTDSADSVAVLDAGALDTLRALAEVGALEDGDVPSKAGRDTLFDLGYIDRDDGANMINPKGRKALAMLDSALPAPAASSTPEPMSWLGFKLVNQAYVDELGPITVPSRFQIGAEVFLGVGQDGDKMDIAVKVIGASFRASKVHYTLAVPIESEGDQQMYAVLHEVDSISIATAEDLLDSATAPLPVASLEAFKDQPSTELPLASAYVAARELVEAQGVLLDDASNEGAIAYLRMGLDVVMNNCPISLEEGNIEQARLQMNMAASFEAALSMLDSASPAMNDGALAQLVAIAKADAMDEDGIADQAALAALLKQGLAEAADGLYFVTDAGRASLSDNGMDAFGDPLGD